IIGTLRSYQLLLITQSHRFISRTRAAESRASTGTAVARSSRCAAANDSAFAALRPAIPTRSTPGLARRSGTVDWAIAPYPPRMRTFNEHRDSREGGVFIYGFRQEIRSRRGALRGGWRDRRGSRLGSCRKPSGTLGTVTRVMRGAARGLIRSLGRH